MKPSKAVTDAQEGLERFECDHLGPWTNEARCEAVS
jgi:hypothetical protein